MTLVPDEQGRVYSEEDEFGVKRLLRAPGGPEVLYEVPMGLVTPPVLPEAIYEPWDGYDELSEAEVLAELDGKSDEEMAVIRQYEQGNLARGSITRYDLRSTVVGSASFKDGQETVPAVSASTGYESMNISGDDGLQAEADRRELTVAGSGSGGNVVKADLVKALQDDDAKSGS